MIFTGQAAPTGAEVTVGFSHDLFTGPSSSAPFALDLDREMTDGASTPTLADVGA
jgi:hypothetical protein